MLIIEQNQKLILYIDNLDGLESIDIESQSNLAIYFRTRSDSSKNHQIQVNQKSNSTFRFISIINHCIESSLNLNIVGDNTITQICNLVEIDDKLAKLDQSIQTGQSNNDVIHLTKIILSGKANAQINHTAKALQNTQNLILTQKIQSINLSPTARISMMPILQIHSDDVQCKHGATQGFLDNKALFFLRSRGLNIEFAQELLLQSFRQEIINFWRE